MTRVGWRGEARVGWRGEARRRRAWAGALVVLAIAALALPAAAFGHATLVRTVPSASGVVNQAPSQITLTFSEPVEARFASVSVSDAGARQVTEGRPTRSGNTLTVKLQPGLEEGWYLVFYRVISTDGHPVRGAYTFALGPNPGPPPEFSIPSIAESAATPELVTARWIVLISAMVAIGLFVLRLFIARPIGQLQVVTRAFAVSCAVALLAAPVYLVLATAQFSLGSVVDVFPLLDASEFGRGLLLLELTFALFAAAAAIAIWLDQPERERRTIADLLATTGATLAAAGVLFIPGTAGHPGTAEPRGLAIVLDAVHLAAGSIWLGGLVGLALLWRSQDIGRAVKRFSAVALAAVATLVATGVAASIVHLPTLASLWETGYGQALLVKIALLAVALLFAAINLLRSKTPPVRAEIVLVAGAVFAAAIVTSLAPPAKAIAEIGKPVATVGPGPVNKTVTANGYQLTFAIAPNRAAANNTFDLTIKRAGRPVQGATVTASFAMLDMEMGRQEFQFAESQLGTYSRDAPALVMVGRWGLTFDIEPPGQRPFTATILDHADG